MGTIRESLIKIATDAGANPGEYLREYLERRLAPPVPNRYRRLVGEILWRLPEAWDVHADWSLDISLKQRSRRYGSTLRIEEGKGDAEKTVQHWVVTLNPVLLYRLSDTACRWVIAHEFGHVASGFPTRSIIIGGKPGARVKGTAEENEEAPPQKAHEDAADQHALQWGFSEELQAFLDEESRH